MCYTREQIDFLKNNVRGLNNQQLANLFNKKFNANKSASAMKGIKERLKISSGLNGSFKKGHTINNGRVRKNRKPIGYEYVDKEGYTYIKIGQPCKYVYKHRYLYERKFGKIPEGYNIIFADQNKSNFDLDNLLLVDVATKFVANNENLLFKDEDLTKTGLLIAELKIKKRKIEKEKL